MAEMFFSFAEDPTNEIGALRNPVSYGGGAAPMKAFIQERLAALVLVGSNFRVFSMPLDFSLRSYPPEARETLTTIDVLKRKISSTAPPALALAVDELRRHLKFDKRSLMVMPAEPRD